MQVKALLDKTRISHTDPGEVHLMVSLSAPEIEEARRQPIDAVIVLDISSSMSDPATNDRRSSDKLTLAKKAAQKFVEQLCPGDRVGVVVYSSEVVVLAPFGELTDVHRQEVTRRIAELQTQDSTDLVAGALRGLGMLAECPAGENRTRRVILFTDGLPTTGITEHPRVMEAITAKLDGKTPITTVGFGAGVVPGGMGSGGYDPELLTSIAQAGGGNFYHAEGLDGILSAFAEELGALRSAAASDVRVEISPRNGLSVESVLNDYPTRTEGDAIVVQVGSLYGGESQYVVARLKVPIVDKVFPRQVLAGAVKVSGVEVNAGSFSEQHDVHFHYAKPEEADDKPAPEVEEQRLRLVAAKEVEKAYRAARSGDYRSAVGLIVVVRRAAERLGTEESVLLAKSLQGLEADVSDARRFRERGGSVRSASHSYSSRRTVGGSPRTDHLYRTESQVRARRDTGLEDEESDDGGDVKKRPN